MSTHPSLRLATAAVVVALAGPPPVLRAQVATAPTSATAPSATARPVTHDVYDSWKSIQNVRLSEDGNWAAFTIQPQDGDGEVVAKNLRTGAEWRHPRGREAQFSADSRHLVFAVAAPKAEVDKAKKAKKKPEDQPKAGLGVLDLASGQAFAADRVKSFRLPKDSGRVLAYLREAPEKEPGEKKDEAAEKKEEEKSDVEKKKEKKKEPGTDLVIRDLTAGTETVVAEVTDCQWTRDGRWLAYAVSSRTPASDGVFARQVSDGSVRALATGQGNYKGLVFDEAGAQLAFVTDKDDYQADAPRFALYAWTTQEASAAKLVDGATTGMPSGAAVSEHGKLEFSRDGQRLFLGTAPVPKARKDDDPEPTKVDIWHYKDPLLQSMQKVRADEEKKRSYRAVVHLKDRRFVQLASPEMPEVTLTPDGTHGVGLSDVAYRQLVSWDSDYTDAFLLNLDTGAARRVVERARFEATISPEGQWLLYYDAATRAWASVSTRDGKVTHLTARLGVSFEDETWDTPSPPRPYGVAGWTERDASVLVYDRYDIWELAPDGSRTRMVTAGRGRATRHVYRYLRLDPEQRAIAAGQPLVLSVTNDDTKASGFARASLQGPEQEPARLLMLDKSVGGLVEAKRADTFVFTQQRFHEFPDLWLADASFASPKRLTDANPQQREFRWGRSELISFTNADGRQLRAILTKPDDFDPAKKYPLMVYIYEELTNGLHRYVAPAPGTSVNVTRYVSNGYVVLQPDIVYDTGYPGESAYKCVLPAVQRVLDMGFVDPKRVGIQGHSWGGYQITYLVTRTDMFRAVEAGASVSNMVSAYGGIRWGTGMSRAFQYERDQSRIGGPPWEHPLQFIENSPIFWVPKINTPYLTVHNDEDDAVPWYQGIEFFTAMRRLGKEIYFFNYNGEKHGLRERENQKHWTVHMAEFFDHYLLGAPRPAWMDTPVPYLERGTRDVTTFFRKPGEAATAPTSGSAHR